METTIEVVVEELWRSTVAKTPIIKFDRGLFKILLSRNAAPAALPVDNTCNY